MINRSTNRPNVTAESRGEKYITIVAWFKNGEGKSISVDRADIPDLIRQLKLLENTDGLLRTEE